jgi:23S rRNA (uracil1939-C5)-methyltransferase
LLLTIEKLLYGGDGLTRLSTDDAPAGEPAKNHGRGKAVFVPFVIGGETIEASLTGQKTGFARAKVDAIVEPSPYRIQPRCPYFGQCGGCHYQHIAYEQQLEIKKDILRETLRRTAKVELPDEIVVHASPPWNYRNRSRLQVQTRPAFSAGYFRPSSHDLLPVEQCPISSPLINRAISTLWQHGHAGKVPEGIREIEFFANADDSHLLLQLSCSTEARRASVRAWAEDLIGSMAEIAGVIAFREIKPGSRKTGANRPAAQKTGANPEKLVTVGMDYLTYKTESASYRVSAGSFFQTNRFLSDELVKIVTHGQSGELALDLYAGVGLFSTALACDFHHTVSVESSQTSSADLAYNLPSNGKAAQATAEQYLIRLQNVQRGGAGTVLPQVAPHIAHRPDLAVVDPPRSGLGESVARLLANLGAPRITYVSCDPATLARDLVILLAAGYRVEQLHLVDLFPQTFHLETVTQLER